jgi:transposase
MDKDTAKKMVKMPNVITNNQIINVVKLLAIGRTEREVSTQLNMTKSSVQKVCTKLNIRGMEDARKCLDYGEVKKMLEEKEKATLAADLIRSQPKMVEVPIQKSEPAPSLEEVHAKAKREKVRHQLHTSDNAPHLIPDERKEEFYQCVLSSLRTTRERFGLTFDEIRREVKRLFPKLDPSMLR